MKTLKCLGIIYCLFVCPYLLCSSFELTLKRNMITNSNFNELNSFIKSIESRLPPNMKNEMPFKINVIFKKLDDLNEVPIPICFKHIHEYKENINKTQKTIYGKVKIINWKKTSNYQIYINKNFISEILKGENNASSFSCGLKNMYRLAESAVIHELTHLYDQSVPFSDTSHRTKEKWQQLKNLLGWSKNPYQYNKYDQTNILQNRSPNPWEYHSPKESFAINMSYWLLDPFYFQHRPSIATFFENFWEYYPKTKNSIPPVSILEIYNKDPFNQAPSLINLNADRVYAIHLLDVAPGKTWETQFGHTMFHIVICSDKRSQLGPECLNDVENHIVLTIAADTQNQKLNPMKTITNGYFARPFIFSFLETRNKYTKEQLRDMSSYPLKMNRQEIEIFIYEITEEILSRKVKYNFFKKNCSTRAIDLLRGAMSNPKLQNIHTISPDGLVSKLKAIGILQNKNKIIYPSVENDLELALANLHNKIGLLCPQLTNSNLSNYLSPSNINLQIKCFENIIKNAKNGLLKYSDISEILYSFYFLERHMMLIYDKKVTKETQLIIDKIKLKDEKERTLIENRALLILSKLLESYDLLFPQYNSSLSFDDYGLPIIDNLSELSERNIEKFLITKDYYWPEINAFFGEKTSFFLEQSQKLKDLALTIGNQYLGTLPLIIEAE